MGALNRKFSDSVDKLFDLIVALDIDTLKKRMISSFSTAIRSSGMVTKYLLLWTIHHLVIPLMVGMCIQFAVWAPVMLKTNQTLCLSVLEAFIEGLVVWELLLPIAPIAMLGDGIVFEEHFRIYCDTPFHQQSLGWIALKIYWPILSAMIVHWFLPIAMVQSSMFRMLLFGPFESTLLVRKEGMDDDELILDYNRNLYLKHIMRNLIRLRILLFYKTAIKKAGCNLWDQFINDRYVVGRKLVNYYYAVQEKGKKEEQLVIQDAVH